MGPLEPGIDPEVVGRDGRGDEAGLGRLEGDGSDFDPPDDLVFESLVVDLDVVVGAEIPFGVIIHVDDGPVGR